MPPPNQADMAEATRLTREGRLQEATALLQAGLRGVPDAAPSAAVRTDVLDLIPPTPESGGAWTAPDVTRPVPKPPMPGILRGLKAKLPGLDEALGRLAPQARGVDIPEGARFEERVHAGPAGSRPYKLYVPSRFDGTPLPLVVMLHGCIQSPDDFAAGTRMNEVAEEVGLLVAYPGQTQGANAQRCWNWFNPADQRRGAGEPALIAGIAREVMAEMPVQEGRVFVAGLSAGGAQAAIMAATYPDLFAAVGVHSGLACGAARDMPGAFAAMRQGGGATGRVSGPTVPTIVFHGDRDATVHPVNGDEVAAQAGASGHGEVTRSRSPGGMAFTRTVRRDAAGRAALEQWVLHGAGHAWSGGSAAGSYTDPRGPDASREMVRFFLAQAGEG